MKPVAAPVQTHPSAHSGTEDRAILSFSLLLAVLVAGVVLSLTHAEANHSLLSILN